MLSDGGNGSPATFDMLKSWIDNCTSNHERCSLISGRDPPLPTRVLDLGFSDSDPIRLVESAGMREQYICLSYRWGKGEFMKITNAIIDHYKRGIAFEELPRTFQDTVKITRMLGIRYLWIDALCIIQNEPDLADWNRESVRMADVFQYSYIIISATRNNSPFDGLFKPLTPGQYGPVNVCVVRHPVDGPGATEFVAIGRGYPMLSRAWTYQERLLPPRVLHFNLHEATWECLESHACQCPQCDMPNFTKASANTVFDEDLIKSDFYNVVLRQRGAETICQDDAPLDCLWRRIVSGYSPPNLTVKSDKLAAVSGIADVIQQATGWKYLAGLWRKSLPQDLCWAAYSYSDWKVVGDSPRQPQTRRSPTWSWASTDQFILWHPLLSRRDPDFINRFQIHQHVEILDAGCTLSTPSATGPVEDGYLDLRCHIIQVN